MGRRSRSIQGNGDVRVCVQGSGPLVRGDPRAGAKLPSRSDAHSPNRVDDDAAVGGSHASQPIPGRVSLLVGFLSGWSRAAEQEAAAGAAPHRRWR
jgi:hypothetical protein